MKWLYAAPLVTAALHITEEFFIPGGFAEWDRRYRPALARSITTRFHIVINALLLLICYDTWALRDNAAGPFLWFAVAGLLSGNALWHLRGAWKTHSYSPGMVTGVLLYIPLMICGCVLLLPTGGRDIFLAALALAAGFSYPLISRFMHTLRSRGGSE